MTDDLENYELNYPVFGERDEGGERLWCELCGAQIEEGVPHAPECPLAATTRPPRETEPPGGPRAPQWAPEATPKDRAGRRLPYSFLARFRRPR